MSLFASAVAGILAAYLLTPSGGRKFVKAVESVEKVLDDRALKKLEGKPVILDEILLDACSKD